MSSNPNFYENLQEAQFRLLRTIVMYADVPYRVMAICNHREDGIFRVYLQPINWGGEINPAPEDILMNYAPQNVALGGKLDEWLETTAGKASGILRKQMDSKHFNNFRPFPLGMCNHGSRTYYIEWSPLRQQFQGLTVNAIIEEPVTLFPKGAPARRVETHTPSFYECIKGEHPSAADCLAALKDPATDNDAHAFHRRFALVRGPIDMLFLAYKSDIVGVLPKLDFSLLKIGRSYGYCKEVIAELRLFTDIIQ